MVVVRLWVQSFIGDNGQRVYVCPSSNLIGIAGFWGLVPWCADDGSPRIWLSGGTQIDKNRTAITLENDVRGLYVPMNESFFPMPPAASAVDLPQPERAEQRQEFARLDAEGLQKATVPSS